MNFGANLKSLRKAQGLTQLQVARRLGITEQAVSRWENNHAEPNMETCADLCLILGCTLHDLTGNESRPLSQDEREIVNMYRRASDEIRDVIRTILRSRTEAER